MRGGHPAKRPSKPPFQSKQHEWVAGIAPELRGVITHDAAIAFAEGMNGVDAVYVVAKPVEKLVSKKPAKALLSAHVGEQLVEFARDVGHVREARAALGGIDDSILASAFVEVLKEMLMVER